MGVLFVFQLGEHGIFGFPVGLGNQTDLHNHVNGFTHQHRERTSLRLDSIPIGASDQKRPKRCPKLSATSDEPGSEVVSQLMAGLLQRLVLSRRRGSRESNRGVASAGSAVAEKRNLVWFPAFDLRTLRVPCFWWGCEGLGKGGGLWGGCFW